MFTGFTPETIDFLWGIRMNNNREWFQANKKQYVLRCAKDQRAQAEGYFWDNSIQEKA